MTRTEQLARQKDEAAAAVQRAQQALDRIAAAERTEARKLRTKRRLKIGTAVDQAGLFVLDDTTLMGLFTALVSLALLPQPVAMLEGLLADPALLACAQKGQDVFQSVG